jgi:hypothetical protein
MGAEQVRLFKRIEREKAEEMLDDYIQQCSEIKVPFSFTSCFSGKTKIPSACS